MTHYTLNTGDAVHSPRSGVSDEAIKALLDLVERGGSVPGFAPFRVSVDHGTGSAVFTVWRAQEPIVTCGVAWTERGEMEAWSAIERVYLALSDRHPQLMAPAHEATKPETLPWLAVVLLPSILNQRRDDIGWLGDFERCLAWTIMEYNISNR